MSHGDANSNAPPPESNPEIYTYFAVSPPADDRGHYQCYCAHPYTVPDLSDSSDSDGDHQHMYTVRCTNSFTQQDDEAGWTLCLHCRPSPELLYARSFQVGEFAEECIALNQIHVDLDPPLHYGYYMEATQINQRLRRVQ